MGFLLLLNPYLWDANGEYIGECVESGGVCFDTGDEVWDLLIKNGIDPWEVNEAFLHMHHQRGVVFEFSSRDHHQRSLSSQHYVFGRVHIPMPARSAGYGSPVICDGGVHLSPGGVNL